MFEGLDDQTTVGFPVAVTVICKVEFWQTETLFPAFKLHAPDAAKLKNRNSAKIGNLTGGIRVEHDFGRVNIC